tara:strand:- start:180 stop:431 length:252 start_codon:yes stop_codon:yes gene_type:complete
MSHGVSPFFLLILGLIVSSIAGIMNQDQELFLILMGMFGIFVIMSFAEQNKDLEDENRNLRRDPNNRSESSVKRRKKRKKRKK